MCLNINVEESNRKVAELREKGEPVIAWKVVLENGCGPYFYIGYNDGLNQSTRWVIDLFEDEIESGRVEYGFHCFATEAGAESEIKWQEAMREKPYIQKIVIDPKDVVAIGEFQRQESIVCTQFTMKKEEVCA